MCARTPPSAPAPLRRCTDGAPPKAYLSLPRRASPAVQEGGGTSVPSASRIQRWWNSLSYNGFGQYGNPSTACGGMACSCIGPYINNQCQNKNPTLPGCNCVCPCSGSTCSVASGSCSTAGVQGANLGVTSVQALQPNAVAYTDGTLEVRAEAPRPPRPPCADCGVMRAKYPRPGADAAPRRSRAQVKSGLSYLSSAQPTGPFTGTFNLNLASAQLNFPNGVPVGTGRLPNMLIQYQVAPTGVGGEAGVSRPLPLLSPPAGRLRRER